MEINTKILEPTEENIALAAKIIVDGGLVAFPTETVYGLGADALNPAAVGKVYSAKGRPSDNPMIVHIARASDIGQLTSKLSPDLVALIDNFWPGPLTLVVKKKKEVPLITTGGLDSVGVRMPDEDVALKLLTYAGVPVAAPSANLSGKPSPTKASHVIEDLRGKVDAILTGPDCRLGIESTVLDMTGEIPMILRPGMITKEDLEAVLKKPVELDPSLLAAPGANVNGYSASDADGYSGQAGDFDSQTGIESPEFKPKAPGMKYKHYAPKAEMVVIEGRRERVKQELVRLKALNEGIGRKVGIILFEEKAFREAAHDFFAELRELDSQDVDLILAGALSDADGLGFAVMNRMLKSSGYNIVKVK